LAGGGAFLIVAGGSAVVARDREDPGDELPILTGECHERLWL
jgi:hypothetical protein